MARVTVCIPSIEGRENLRMKAKASVANQTIDADIIIEIDYYGEGPAVLRNRMLEKVETEFVAWLDDDDIMYETHLEDLIKVADEEGADIVYPWFDCNSKDPIAKFEGKPWSNDNPHIFPVTHLARTEKIREIGGWPIPDYSSGRKNGGEDIMLIRRMAKSGFKIVHLNKRTWLWNHKSKNTSGLPSKAQKIYKKQKPEKSGQNFIVIPVKNRLEITKQLIDELIAQAEYKKIFVYDNGSTDGTAEYIDGLGRGVERIWTPKMSIYEMWNDGWSRCQKLHRYPNVAILNNDIKIPKKFISTMATHLRKEKGVWAVYPDYKKIKRKPDGTITKTKGTYRKGGLSGFAFMIKGEMPIEKIDTRFQWWYGDDDLVYKIEKKGYTAARINGLVINHISGASASQLENRAKKISEDKKLWKSLGRN
jgi:glycosyltransferase involved in cell wall biosynthesis